MNGAAIHFGMPVSVIIEDEERLTITRGEGLVTDEDFLNARAALLVNPRFDPAFDRIWDFYDVTEARVSPEVAERLVGGSPGSENPICRAVIMSKSSAPVNAILDFIQRTRRSQRRIAVFPDMKSARRWIATACLDVLPE
jgi:hypothetical protein